MLCFNEKSRSFALSFGLAGLIILSALSGCGGSGGSVSNSGGASGSQIALRSTVSSFSMTGVATQAVTVNQALPTPSATASVAASVTASRTSPGTLAQSASGGSANVEVYTSQPASTLALGVSGQTGYYSLDVSGQGTTVGSFTKYKVTLGMSASAASTISGPLQFVIVPTYASARLSRDSAGGFGSVTIYICLANCPSAPIPPPASTAYCDRSNSGNDYIGPSMTDVGTWQVEFTSQSPGGSGGISYLTVFKMADGRLNATLDNVTLTTGSYNTATGIYVLNWENAVSTGSLSFAIDAEQKCLSGSSNLGNPRLATGTWTVSPKTGIPDSLLSGDYGILTLKRVQ